MQKGNGARVAAAGVVDKRDGRENWHKGEDPFITGNEEYLDGSVDAVHAKDLALWLWDRLLSHFYDLQLIVAEFAKCYRPEEKTSAFLALFLSGSRGKVKGHKPYPQIINRRPYAQL